MSDHPTARYAYIDALRGWAILLVLLIHVSQGQFALQALSQSNPDEQSDIVLPLFIRVICNAGGDGVVLFFVISALSLTMSAKAKPISDLRAYAARRFFRIAPMYYFGVALYLVLFGWGPRYMSSTGISTADVIANLTFTHSFRDSAINSVVPGGWSVGAEAIFYIFLPLVLYILDRAPKLYPIMAILSVFLSLAFLPFISGDVGFAPVAKFYPINYVSAFTLGIGGGLFLARVNRTRQGRNEQSVGKLSLLLYLHPETILICIIVLAPLIALAIAIATIHELYVPVEIVATSILGVILCVRLHYDKRNNSMIVNSVTRRIGKVSFSLYIIHFALLSPVYHFVGASIADRGIMFLIIYYTVLASCSFGLANITYELVERPFIRSSRKFTLMATSPPLTASRSEGSAIDVKEREGY